MKYLIVLMLFVTACTKHECPSKEFRNDFIYNDKVSVTEGFYKGQSGFIRSGVWVYDGYCAIPGFEVQLKSTGVYVNVDQRSLVRSIK